MRVRDDVAAGLPTADKLACRPLVAAGEEHATRGVQPGAFVVL